MIQKIKSLFKAARLLSSDDSGSYRRGTFFYQGQTGSKAVIFTPYGLCSRPPDEAMAIILSQNGQDSNGIAFVDDPLNRFKDLEKGEVAIGNYLTGSRVVFKENGDIDITANADINIALTGAATITAGSMVCVINSDGIDITDGDVVADGISLKTHTHPITSGSSAPGPTGAPT